MRQAIKRGEIYYANLAERRDHVLSGYRPCVVVSADRGNRSSPNVTIVPLTSKRMRQETHAEVWCRVRSTALCENVQTISKARLVRPAGRCTDGEMREIERALKTALGMRR